MASEPSTDPDGRARLTEIPLSGSRSQSMQRLQIGLSGLAAMILLVGLANIIMDRAKESEEQAVPEAAATVVPKDEARKLGSDPLADVGVVPDLPASPSPSPTTSVPRGAGNAAPPLQTAP